VAPSGIWRWIVDTPDRRFFSVTTILKVLDKPGLNRWRENRVAATAVRLAGSLAVRVAEDGAEATLKRLTAYEPSEAELGSAVHIACEQYAKTGKRPRVRKEVGAYMDRFGAWLDLCQPVFSATEQAVYSTTYRFAGTLDAIATIEGCKVLVDWKSHAKPTGAFADSALQLAAYRFADLITAAPPRRVEKGFQRYYLLGEPEEAKATPMPVLDGAVIVSLSPEDCTMYPMRADQEVFNVFLFALELFRWNQEIAKTVVGAPWSKG
jgi:hypothetical protein